MSCALEPQIGIQEFYRELMEAWGPQDWWPAQTRFEVILGAFLTQNTAWTNVERALRRLRESGLLSVDGIRRTPAAKLAGLIRSSGYFRQKAKRLKTFVAYLDWRYQGSLDRMFARPTGQLRRELLELNGVGPETADSILLYAGGHPVFVVDAYTRRIFERHGLSTAKTTYDEIRQLVEQALASTPQPAALTPRQPPLGRRRHKLLLRRATAAARAFDEFHALLVQTAKRHCLKAAAQCEGCPLQPFLTK